jgi:hypothetical protein
MFDFDVVTGPTPPRGPGKGKPAGTAGRAGPPTGESGPREAAPEEDGHRGG